MGATPILPFCILFRPRTSDAVLQVVAPELETKLNRAALDLQVSRLLLAGQCGELLLIYLTTLEVLVPRKVA